MSELLGVAVLAHRNGRYQDAVDLLLQILQTDRQNWLGWFYLGMSYGKLGNMTNAHRIFRVIVEQCPEQKLKDKAEQAMPALEAEVRQRVTGEKPRPRRFNLDSTDLRTAL